LTGFNTIFLSFGSGLLFWATLYYARRNCPIFIHARAPGGTCPSAP